MFKNFGKVFGFTFSHKAKTKGFISLTLVVALLLAAVPILIFTITSSNTSDDEAIKECKAQKIFVVDEMSKDANLNLLNSIPEKNYQHIQYVNYADLNQAFEAAAKDSSKKILILEIKEEDESVTTQLYLPEATELTETDAMFFNDYIDTYNSQFAIITSGVDIQDMVLTSMPMESDVYTVSGLASGKSLSEDTASRDEINNTDIQRGLQPMLLMIVCMLVYFMVLAYGSSISMNIVMEKDNKLMDTMLVSVKPRAMILGKLLAITAAGLLQILVWVGALIGGVFGGLAINEAITGKKSSIVIFFQSLSSLHIFTPLNLVLAVLATILGILFFSSIAAFTGAISGNKEEAAAKNGLFVALLVIGFFYVFSHQGGEIPTSLYMIPPIAAMITPSAAALGSLSMGTILLSIGVTLVCDLLLVALSGRAYHMMSLYKGQPMSITKAVKLVFKKQKQ